MKCKFSFIIYLILFGWQVFGQKIENSSAPMRTYNGLLSDFLQAHNYHKLNITHQCNDQLKQIQLGLNVKDVWAIKCKFFLSIVYLLPKNF